jgi:hypothetical protein
MDHEASLQAEDELAIPRDLAVYPVEFRWCVERGESAADEKPIVWLWLRTANQCSGYVFDVESVELLIAAFTREAGLKGARDASDS